MTAQNDPALTYSNERNRMICVRLRLCSQRPYEGNRRYVS